jgi:thiosulfate/3-mercaptopyruvate sulfurtransferase
LSYTTLVDTETLGRQLHDPSYVVVDCRFRLDDTAWGEHEYAAAHIEGAAYAHLDRDLSGSRTGTNGRHPLPDVATLCRTLGAFGIGSGTQVVAYDQDSGMFASRLWWLLRWLGHTTVAVLDGGFAKWTAEGRPIRSGVERRAARQFTGAARAGDVATLEEVLARVGDPSWRLVDARAPERYRGEVEPVDRVAGHIPGAVNRFFKANLREDGTFRPADQLAAMLREATDAAPPERVICYCGSGVTACHNLLAMEHAGLPGAKLYPGSWSEWSSDPERPVERGTTSSQERSTQKLNERRNGPAADFRG